MAIHDVDEFVFSPQHLTVQAYLTHMMEQHDEVTVVKTRLFRYGRRQREGQVVWPELLIEDQMMRAPSIHFGEDLVKRDITAQSLKQPCEDSIDTAHLAALYAKLVEDGVVQKRNTALLSKVGCSQDARDGSHKSMFRTNRGCSGWVHHPKHCKKGVTIYAQHTQLRGNHYFLRSLDDLHEKARMWRKGTDDALVRTGADQFYDTVFDGSAVPYSLRLRAKLLKLYSSVACAPSN